MEPGRKNCTRTMSTQPGSEVKDKSDKFSLSSSNKHLKQPGKSWADILKTPAPSTSNNTTVVELSSDSEPEGVLKSANGCEFVNGDSDIDVVSPDKDDALVLGCANLISVPSVGDSERYSDVGSDCEIIAVTDENENDNVILVEVVNEVEVVAISDSEDVSVSSIEDVRSSNALNQADSISISSATTVPIGEISTLNSNAEKELNLDKVSKNLRQFANDLESQSHADLDDDFITHLLGGTTSTQDDDLRMEDMNKNIEDARSLNANTTTNANDKSSTVECVMLESESDSGQDFLLPTQNFKQTANQPKINESSPQPSTSKSHVTPRKRIRSMAKLDSVVEDQEDRLSNTNTTTNEIISSQESNVIRRPKNKRANNSIIMSGSSQDNMLPKEVFKETAYQSEINELTPPPSTSPTQKTHRKRIIEMPDSDDVEDDLLNLNRTTNNKKSSQESIAIRRPKNKGAKNTLIRSGSSQDANQPELNQLTPPPSTSSIQKTPRKRIIEMPDSDDVEDSSEESNISAVIPPKKKRVPLNAMPGPSLSSPQPSTSKSQKNSSRKRIRAASPPDSDTNSDSDSNIPSNEKSKRQGRPSPKKVRKHNSNSPYKKSNPRRSVRFQAQAETHDAVTLAEGSDSNESLFIPIIPDKKKKLRRSGRKQNKTSRSATSNVFEQLLKARERKASKPKRDSPDREKTSNSKSDDSDSDSTYYSEYSPVPIVDESEDSPVPTDFEDNGPTPSSSSVTSGAETEVPDLGSGSEGDKELSHCSETEDRTEGDDLDEPSVSSSSDEAPDDGQNDTRCILCKNLGSGDFERRAYDGNPNAWCKCGECTIYSPLVGDYDLICCREVSSVVDFINDELDDPKTCITKHPRFQFDVLEYEAYARSVSKHTEAKRYQGTCQGEFYENYQCGKPNERLSNMAKQSFKYADQYGKADKCYSSYLHWIFDKLSKRQMVIPACVQKKIRDKFKIEVYSFEGFKTNYQCPNGRHCRLASGQ